MHQTLLKEVAAQLNQQPHSGGMVNSTAFCHACDASGLPLSHAECFMLGQLLTRRKRNTAGEFLLLVLFVSFRFCFGLCGFPPFEQSRMLRFIYFIFGFLSNFSL